MTWLWTTIAIVGTCLTGVEVVSARRAVSDVHDHGLDVLLRFEALTSLRRQATTLASLVAFSAAGIVALVHHGSVGVPAWTEWLMTIGVSILVAGVVWTRVERRRGMDRFRAWREKDLQ